MRNKVTQSAVLTHIKRKAKAIGREQGIKHALALDQAAMLNGFENYRHALNLATLQPTFKMGHSLRLSIYWQDWREGLRGRESISIALSKPWETIIRRSQLLNARSLSGFAPEDDNHLSRSSMGGQDQAQRGLSQAARAFAFMDATGLRPSKGGLTRAYPSPAPSSFSSSRDSYRIPAQDHSDVWFDSEKRYLITDEPYEASAVNSKDDRENWITRYDFLMVKPNWPGMYNPDGGSRLYLFSKAKNGVPLAPIADALNKLPIQILSSKWEGESITFPMFDRTKTDTPSKIDLKLFDILTTHVRISKPLGQPCELPLQTILSKLGHPDAEPELRSKLKRMESTNHMVNGMSVGISGNNVRLSVPS